MHALCEIANIIYADTLGHSKSITVNLFLIPPQALSPKIDAGGRHFWRVMVVKITCLVGNGCQLYVASPKVVGYLGKQRHRFMRKLHNKNSPKNISGIKPDFTAIPPTETYRCAYQKKALELLKIAVGVRRLLNRLTYRPF